MTYIDEETSKSINQSRRGVLHRVPMQLRQDKKHIYEPLVVPLGPYHHRQHPQSHLVEHLKNELKYIVCGDNAITKCYLLGDKIQKRIAEIRKFYGRAHAYNDGNLAAMMLHDACFLICYMQEGETQTLIRQRLGMSGVLSMNRDVLMLENQIPLWLISLIHPHHQSLLLEFLNNNVCGDNNKLTQLPWGDGRGEEPLHLLEAMHRTSFILDETQENSSILLRLIKKCNHPITDWPMMNNNNTPYWSATDLKAKGVRFKRSTSCCLTDIKFISFCIYAELQLPLFYITYNTEVFFSNAIAFEMSPETDTNMDVTAYFNFMKTLINNAEDVKVLREKGILYNMLANDEEVVEMFKIIDIYGLPNNCFFSDVNIGIAEHYTSKARTWMAQLINTNFRISWTVIALTFLLWLTIIQTYYKSILDGQLFL